MKIMVMSDEESKYIWEHYQPGMFKGIDLIISAGDLKPEYLQFVETMSNLPLLYVHGNHDEKYDVTPPDGCECIEDQIVTYNGIRILGLGGSMRYRSGTHQYTEKDMQRRIRRLKLRLKLCGGFDMLVTHAPMAGFHDGEDLCHKGFEAFRGLIGQYQPKYFVHGHIHQNYGMKAPQLSLFGETVVINAYRTYTFEYDDPAVRQQAEKHKD